MSDGPQFLDEQGQRELKASPVFATPPLPGPQPDAPELPRGPMLLEAGPDAASSLDVGWMPAVIVARRAAVGAGFWIAAGLCMLIVSWLVLSVVSFVLALFHQSSGLGLLSAVAIAIGFGMVLYAVLLEIRAYRSLSTVERLRAVLGAGDTTVAVARADARAWLLQVRVGGLDRVAAERLLQAATSTTEVRAVVRSHIADRLREEAAALGKRAAIEGATVVAVCPHPAWDGVVAGLRGLLVIRSVAALYGLRPGLAVTLALVRRVAWTAAGTAGVSLVSQGLADHVLTNTPVLKHVAGALPGTGAVAVRLYRLAGVTAETCSPVSSKNA